MNGFSSQSGQFWRADPPAQPQRGQEPAAASPRREESRDCSADVLIDLLQETALILKSRMAEHFSEFGLNEIRYTVLKIVHAASPHGCSQTNLAEELKQSESSISTLVERMRTDNLLYRLRSKLDRRKRVLILTERGQAILYRIERCHAERLEQMLREFPDEQRQELRRLLMRLNSHLQSAAEAEAGVPLPAPHVLEGTRRAQTAETLPSEGRHGTD